MKNRHVTAAVLGLAVLAGLTAGCQRPSDEGKPVVHVGSKSMPESVVLEEMVAHLARDAGARVKQHSWLGDTSKTWTGVLSGDLDVYCEYTGTLRQEILAAEHLRTDEALEESLARRGLRISRPLGFNNSYAIAMRRDKAEAKGIRKISDLKDHPELKYGVSTAFEKRADGWEGLRQRYSLPAPSPEGLDHALVYEALHNGRLDVADVYSTEPQIKQFDLLALEDDQHYFPTYDAVLLYRADLEQRAPAVVKSVLRLQGAISDDEMREMNARVQLDHAPETQVAAEFLNKKLGTHVTYHVESMAERIGRRTLEHLFLVAVALALGIVVAVPLGVAAARQPWLGHGVLAVVGAVQTVPALAFLVLLVVWLGLGAVPAIVALFCYSLLPIVRNTYTGLRDVPPTIRESADALGLSSFARLYLIDLPLASRSILAGIKTAAVITVGNATLGGLIGAGGYGLTILIGLNKYDPWLLAEGAIPAVVMALVVQGLFDAAERFLVPRGLRLEPAR
jgi:osmoprotectant transport system permease protein